MDNEQFNPVCEQYAKLFDEACIKKDIGETKKLLEKSINIVNDNDKTEFAPLFYSIGTSYAFLRDEKCKATVDNLIWHDNEIIEYQKKSLWYFRHAEELISKLIESDKNTDYFTVFQMSLYVNLANSLFFCGRMCAAISYYNKALKLGPFAMAFGNIGRSLEHYAYFESSKLYKNILYKKAYQYYLSAENSKDKNIYEEAKNYFSNNRKRMEEFFGKEFFLENDELLSINIDSYEEYLYRKWCLENHLFLNILNDLPDQNDFFMKDILKIDSITTEFDRENPPFVFEMFNQIKEEYIYARYLLYKSIERSTEVHYADKETHLDDILNYGNYSIRIEQLKTSYRTLYSIFDRIGYLLNFYLKLEIKEFDINFSRVCEKIEEKDNNNKALLALRWINYDFMEPFAEKEIPYSKKLKNLRNALEHKFVSVHQNTLDNELKADEDNIYRVEEQMLINYSMTLVKLIREAIIELIFAIRIEENNKNQNSKNTLHLTLPEFKDEYKL